MTNIPPHLAPYVADQRYDRYTPVDHAVWRYVMRQNRRALRGKAHDAYVNGLALSGIGTERIPRVSEMNDCLARIGWGAAIVNGLIPGAVFYELLASGILPIAAEIRKLSNIAYTPAPDILHEAAGHAPILFDPDYRSYVREIGAIGAKAFSSPAKGAAFEALRRLTIVMEDPASTAEEREAAKRDAEEKQRAAAEMTEAEKVSRLFWATVEYGLVGDLADPKIYGAGLLSSVGESKHCFTDAVTKLPYSVEACAASPKIVTEMQSKLFVCKNFDELKEGARSMANTMAFRVGGTPSLETAKRSGGIATFEFDSGLGVTGVVASIVKDKDGEAVYVNTAGETALSARGRQLPGHGRERHPRGYGTPIGRLLGNVALEACGADALAELGIAEGRDARLAFESGVSVCGRVAGILRDERHVLLVSFEACTVALDGRELFRPEWGTYDMAAGSRIATAYPGAADPVAYFGAPPPRAAPADEPPPPTELEALYGTVARLRAEGGSGVVRAEALREVHRGLDRAFPRDWLLRLELLELAASAPELRDMEAILRAQLDALAGHASVANLIRDGLAVLA
ncbi:phenylalanine-4-hydroxylase [Paenibacillus sp. UNC496MF]|uniref:aromatic amino acid hydroxylase n=1 Tax=Paenibacillus sp. UNC496MF TaxID=1502753 RepID=UPI0008E3C140|nr:aromatic amino acid hydroxylase [Paenibacillus sp. UNC496MF]SFI38584.1 phenylalanine-4-hydroxylase [Paenibacillus sp. UNC496MF]